jgi:FxsC-like protein
VSGTDKAPDHSGQSGSYFFLSYEHSPPLAGSLKADPDQWVRRFFNDLKKSVARHGRPRSGLAPGFFDQQIPLGSDWKAAFSRALGAAEVFVPLYSPGYLARSWPGREWACFHQRMVQAGLEDPMRRFVPVLWIPLPSGQDPPGLQEALAVGASEPAYAENGLRALLRLTPYRASYEVVVDRLAARIVEIAENTPVHPSDVPDIAQVQSQFSAEASIAVFAVAVAALALPTLPDGRDPAGYGDSSIDWRPFPHDQEISLAEYAARVAEQLDFAVLVTALEKTGDRLSDKPGVILIDPWFIASDQGLGVLRSFVSDLPSWVLPLLVLDSTEVARAGPLTQEVKTILDEAGVARTEAARHAIRGVSSLKEFVSLMPILVAEAERHYLRHGPGQRSTAGPGSRPRLADDDGWSASPATPPHPKEKPDA